MNIWQFVDRHWFLAFCIICAVYGAITAPIGLAHRFIRHRNIVARGWPPSHLDADGGWKPEKAA